MEVGIWYFALKFMMHNPATLEPQEIFRKASVNRFILRKKYPELFNYFVSIMEEVTSQPKERIAESLAAAE